MNAKKIRVLQFPVRNTGGGITAYALNNWKYIDKAGFVFDFATCDKHLDFEDELAAQGCGIHYLSCYAEDAPEKFRAEFNAILDEGYDAVHLHTSYWKSFTVEELAAARGVPVVVVHSHNSNLGGLPAKADRKEALAIHEKKKSEFTTELATHFCACSKLAADWLFGPRIPRDRIAVLPNAIDVEKFAFNPDVRRRCRIELGIDGKFVIGHVGRFEYQKNHDFLLDVFAETAKEVPSAVLLSVGVGELFDEIKAKAERLGILDRILFLGKRNDVENLYQAMDAFALTSRFEGLAIVLIEAQCAGLATTTTTTTTMPENVITDNIVGLPFDADAWRKRIARLAKEGYERRDRSAEAAAAGYSIKEQIRRLERIYAGETKE
jgi:glycosyltransferase involved in cell wall biosynthesis